MKGTSIFTVLLCLMLLPVLTACSETQKDYGDEYIFGQDSQYFSPGLRRAAYTENGFYAISLGNEQIIDYIDTKSGKAVPLCGKPDCDHRSESCNAHFPVRIIGLVYYDNHLYVMAENADDLMTVGLYRMSLDGSERVKIVDLYRSDDEDVASDNGYATPVFFIHRGMGYLVINWTVSKLKESRQSIYKVPLNGDEKEILVTYEGYNPSIDFLAENGSYIYYAVDERNRETKEWEDSYYRLDIRNDEITQLELPKEHMLINVINGRIYTMIKNEDGSRTAFVTEEGKEVGKDSEEFYFYEYEMPFIYRDGKYIYWYNSMAAASNNNIEKNVKIIDYDRNNICDITNAGRVIWSDTIQILTYDYDTQKYYLHDIETGKKTAVDTVTVPDVEGEKVE